MMNVKEIINSTVKKSADKVFLIDAKTEATFTYGQVHERALAVGDYLRSMGLKKGDRVAIVLDNSISFCQLYFGCLYHGFVVAPVNPVLPASQIEYIIKNSRAKLLIYSLAYAPKLPLDKLTKEGVKLLLLNDENTAKASPEGVTISTLKPGSSSAECSIENEDDLIMIHTSGTTAEPKAIVHNAFSLFDNGKKFTEYLKIDSESRFLNILPMSYLGGYYNLLLIPFLSNGSVVITSSFSAESVLRFWDPIIKYNVTTLWVVPTIMSLVMEMDRGTKGVAYAKSSLKTVLVGTAPLSKSLKEEFEKKYSVSLLENFALSETLFITSNDREGKKREGVGGILPWAKVKIVDSYNREVEKGEEGEILVQTPHMMKGYVNPESGSSELELMDGWFATGDIGRISDNQELFITGRKKDIIIRGGINISPATIEEVIIGHEDVRECAVVGTPHKFTGEAITAVIRKSDDVDFEKLKKELIAICKENLSPIQQPNEFIELPEFPRTASGKVQKAKIRAWIQDRVSGTEAKDKKMEKGSISFKPSTIVGSSVEAISIKYNNRVYELKAEGKDIIVLSLGEAFFDIPLYPFDVLPYPDLYHYSHTRGVPELRINLAKYFLDKYDLNFDYKTEIMVTAGSKPAIYMALLSIINPGDEVIIHEPAWVSYPEQIKLCHGVPVSVPYNYSVFEFEKFITNRTRAIIINNPNNPRGKIFSLEELSHLYKLAEKYNLYIISDEVYSEFILEKERFTSLGNLDREKKHTLIINAVSKNYGISGWRLGYVITNKDLIDQMLKLNQHLLTCAPTILQMYIAKYFDDIIKITRPQIKVLVEKRERIRQHMLKIGLASLEGTATFYFFVSIKPSKLTSEEFCSRLLNEKFISAVPGLGYGKSCDEYIRVSVGTESDERTKKGLDIIKQLIDETSR